MSYSCNFNKIKTTFVQSNTWFSLWRQQYRVGRIYTKHLQGQFFEVKTKLAGTGWIFPHAPYPVIDKDSISIEEFMSFVDKVSYRAKSEKIDFIKIVPTFLFDEKCISFCGNRGFLISPKAYDYASWHALLDLREFVDDKTLLASFRKSTRYVIRKTISFVKVKILPVSDQLNTSVVSEFWKGLYKYSINKTVIPTYKQFQNMIKQSLRLNSDVQFVLASVAIKGQTTGFALFTIYNDSMFYHYSAFTKKYPRLGLSHVLLFEVLKYAMQRNVNIFSFWGINLPDFKYQINVWKGFTKFKLGFKPEILRFVGPIIIPVTLRGRLALVRDWLGHLKLKFM